MFLIFICLDESSLPYLPSHFQNPGTSSSVFRYSFLLFHPIYNSSVETKCFSIKGSNIMGSTSWWASTLPTGSTMKYVAKFQPMAFVPVTCFRYLYTMCASGPFTSIFSIIRNCTPFEAANCLISSAVPGSCLPNWLQGCTYRDNNKKFKNNKQIDTPVRRKSLFASRIGNGKKKKTHFQFITCFL